jgi:hypothetical protein
VTRPLRSLLIGDVDQYPSEMALGVQVALTRAGHWHNALSIRNDIGVIAKRASEVQPDLIIGHMLMWPPRGPGWATPADLLELCSDWKAKGTKVLIHDGDAGSKTRFPTDISPAVDLALCNHTADRSVWKIPQLHWPYFCFDQAEMADPHPDFMCDLAFAGRLSTEGIYADRTRLVMELKAKLGDRMKIFPNAVVGHTLYRTPELAVSAKAILGYGRPDRPGWRDVRTFLIPGAGGILLTDDFPDEFPGVKIWEDYIPYDPGSVESVLKGLAWVLEMEARVNDHWPGRGLSSLREEVFHKFQHSHSATARVKTALAAVGLTL